MGKKAKRDVASPTPELLPSIHQTLRGLRNDLADGMALSCASQDAMSRALDRIASAVEVIAARTPSAEYVNEAAERAVRLAAAGALTTRIPPLRHRVLMALFDVDQHSLPFRHQMSTLFEVLDGGPGITIGTCRRLIAAADDHASRTAFTPTRTALAMLELAMAGASADDVIAHFAPVHNPRPEAAEPFLVPHPWQVTPTDRPVFVPPTVSLHPLDSPRVQDPIVPAEPDPAPEPQLEPATVEPGPVEPVAPITEPPADQQAETFSEGVDRIVAGILDHDGPDPGGAADPLPAPDLGTATPVEIDPEMIAAAAAVVRPRRSPRDLAAAATSRQPIAPISRGVTPPVIDETQAPEPVVAAAARGAAQTLDRGGERATAADGSDTDLLGRLDDRFAGVRERARAKREQRKLLERAAAMGDLVPDADGPTITAQPGSGIADIRFLTTPVGGGSGAYPSTPR